MLQKLMGLPKIMAKRRKITPKKAPKTKRDAWGKEKGKENDLQLTFGAQEGPKPDPRRLKGDKRSSVEPRMCVSYKDLYYNLGEAIQAA